MRNVAFQIIGDLAVAVYGRHNPTDEEIAAAIEIFAPLDLARARSLVVSDGGAPSPLQREKLINVLGGGEHLAAVVSDALKVRGAVTALSWFNKRVKSFTKAKIDDALEYLSVPSIQRAMIKRELQKMLEQVGR